jgi:hypothetical protein
MSKRLNWERVATCIDREIVERYGDYLCNVVYGKTHLHSPFGKTDDNKRMAMLGSVYDWCRRYRYLRSPLAIRAFSWCVRYCYPFHPVFKRISLLSNEATEALDWIANDNYSFRFSFRFAPAAHNGVVIVCDCKREDIHYFSPLRLIIPKTEDIANAHFDLRMSARLVLEEALRLICVEDREGNYDSIAIRATVRNLLKVAAPMVVDDAKAGKDSDEKILDQLAEEAQRLGMGY